MALHRSASSGVRHEPIARVTITHHVALAFLGAFLLVLSFPGFNQPWCAWVALVPWLLLVRGLTRRAAFWWSYAIGLVFFLASIWWLIHVTLLGWLLLCAYLALYFGAFGWLAHDMLDPRLKTKDSSSSSSLASCVLSPLIVAALWVALEYLRSHLLSGFGWNLLAYSQTPWTPAIQLADVTGAWGVSFVIVWMNVLVADVIRTITVRSPQSIVRSNLLRRGMVLAGVLLAMLGYGAWRLHRLPEGPRARIAVVQGNIPQEQKWDAAYQEEILRRYEALTRAAAQDRPDLIVWPETAVSWIVGVEDGLTGRLQTLVQSIGIPVVVGAPMLRVADGGWRMTNSAALIEASGAIADRYDKLRLVPFGEFIPGERWMPWLRQALPPIGDFVPGQTSTVFETASRGQQTAHSTQHAARSAQTPLKLSVLICFEDIFPALARRFVRKGAQMLAVITNDAWFGPTAAAYQHAQASTFRAVELRRPVVRAANTGWSGCMDAAGRWGPRVADDRGTELFVPGVQTCEVMPGTGQTLYARLGDWLPLLCLLSVVAWGFVKLLQ